MTSTNNAAKQQIINCILVILTFKIKYLVSLSAAWQWSSWAELSTDKESQSQRGCRVLWIDWRSLVSQPGKWVHTYFTDFHFILHSKNCS